MRDSSVSCCRQQPDFEDVTSKRCRARSQDLEQCSTTNNCTDGLSSDPPTCDTATRTLPDYDQPPQRLGVVEGKTWSSKDFITGATHPNHQCSCLLSNNNTCHMITDHLSGWLHMFFCHHQCQSPRRQWNTCQAPTISSSSAGNPISMLEIERSTMPTAHDRYKQINSTNQSHHPRYLNNCISKYNFPGQLIDA